VSVYGGDILEGRCAWVSSVGLFGGGLGPWMVREMHGYTSLRDWKEQSGFLIGFYIKKLCRRWYLEGHIVFVL